MTTTPDPHERNNAYRERIHAYFQSEAVDRYPQRVAKSWQWDHSDEEGYLASVADRRADWEKVINPPDLHPIGDPKFTESLVPGGRWVEVPVHEHLAAEGILVVPPGATQLVVFQHGLASWPEKVFGLPDDDNGYHGIGRDLVEQGYAVLAPMNLIMVDPRNRAQDLARLTGTTMEGLELARCRVLLDAVAGAHPELDTDAVAFVGISWGGMAAQFWTPLEDRFVAAASIAFFNARLQKMAVQDERYVTFADRDEHHAFLPGHLGVFSDAELASLICPRPFLVQHGSQDRIGWTPQIEDEFARARTHWDELGIGDRAELLVHNGGHEVVSENLLAWLDRNFPARAQAD